MILGIICKKFKWITDTNTENDLRFPRLPHKTLIQWYNYLCKRLRFPVKSHEDSGEVGTECWTSILNLTFGTIRTAELSAVRAGRTLPPRKFLGIHFYYRVDRRVLNADRRLCHLKISKDPTGNQTRDLPSCAVIPQPISLICICTRGKNGLLHYP